LFLPARSVQQAWSAPLRHILLIPVVVLGLLAVCITDLLKASPVARQAP